MSVYMDYNATTPLAPSVVHKISESLTLHWGNPSSEHGPGIIAKQAILQARDYLANMIGSENDDIIFTSGGTEANNMVILGTWKYYKAWLKKVKKMGHVEVNNQPHVITTNVEHDAIIEPLRFLEDDKAICLSEVPVDTDGHININHLMSFVRPNTCLITVMLANNETGVVMPVSQLGNEIRELNRDRHSKGLIEILFHTDAAQAMGKMNVHVDDLGVDYLTIVGHKFYGPRIGCLYVRGLKNKRTPLYPLLHGGGQEGGYRSGTLNTPMIVGLGEAARLVGLNLAVYMKNMQQTRDYLEQRLKAEFGDRVVVNCSSPDVVRLPNTSSISLIGDGPELVGHRVLARCSRLIASVGAACHSQNVSSGVLVCSGVPPERAMNTIRFSVGRDTTTNDVDVVIEDLKQAVGSLLHIDPMTQ